MLIGGLGRETNTKVNTIRFYEQIGLMPVPARSVSGQRTYGSDDVTKLSFIRKARGLGLSLNEIRSLIALSSDPRGDCSNVVEIATIHLENVEQRIERLTKLRRELRRLLTSCTGGAVSDCNILASIGDL